MSDWGQGAKKNDIGWGQGAVSNDISWGASHKISWAGDTEIVGTDGDVPVNTVAPVISGTALVGNTLTSTTGTWTSDTGVTGYLYQWTRNGVNISGATNITYTLVNADLNTNIICKVAATDTDGTSAYVNSNSLVIYEVEYKAVLDYGNSLGYTLPSVSQRLKQSILLSSLKTAGVWSKLDTFANFATDGSSNFALIDWKRLSLLTAINSPFFTTNQGFNGNGTSAYIDTNFNPVTNGTNYTKNNASRYAYMLQVQSGANIDVNGQTGSNLRNRMLVGSSSYQSINTVSSNSVSFGYNTNAGMKSINRIDGSNVNLYNDKVFTSVTSNADVFESLNQWLLRGATNFSSTHLISMYAMGGDLVAENDDFVDAFKNYINAL